MAKFVGSIYDYSTLNMNFALLAALWAAMTVGSPCSGYPSPVPGPPRRYPVGYDPDNRSRPAMIPVEVVDDSILNTASWQGYHTTAPPNTPVKPRLSRGAALKLRRSERHLQWKPSDHNTGYSTVKYDPRNRAQSPPPTDGVDLHLSTLHTDGMPEHIDWDGNATLQDGKSICAGMWIGNKIIYKTCVNLTQDL